MIDENERNLLELIVRLRGIVERMDDSLEKMNGSLHGAQKHAHGVLREYTEKNLEQTPGDARTFQLRFDLEARAERLRADIAKRKEIFVEVLADLKEMKAKGEKSLRSDAELEKADLTTRSYHRMMWMYMASAISKTEANVDMCAHFDFVISEMEDIAMALD